MTRATDPMRMNWLWRLICEVADVQVTEMVEALQATQVAVDQRLVRSWTVSDRDDSFFPMTIAEVERNLRALVLSRNLMRANRDAPAEDLPGKERLAFGAGPATAGHGVQDDELGPPGSAQGIGPAFVAQEAVDDA